MGDNNWEYNDGAGSSMLAESTKSATERFERAESVLWLRVTERLVAQSVEC